MNHFIIHCSVYQPVRETFLPKLLETNPHIIDVFGNPKSIMLLILDPLHSKLPEKITRNWTSAKAAYEISKKKYHQHAQKERENVFWIWSKQLNHIFIFVKVRMLVVERLFFDFAIISQIKYDDDYKWYQNGVGRMCCAFIGTPCTKYSWGPWHYTWSLEPKSPK